MSFSTLSLDAIDTLPMGSEQLSANAQAVECECTRCEKISIRKMAVGQGFEPREPFGSTVFKTAAFDRSASPPKK